MPDTVEVTHVPFGLVKGEDGKKLKTRSGETIKLKDLLNEAGIRLLGLSLSNFAPKKDRKTQMTIEF